MQRLYSGIIITVQFYMLCGISNAVKKKVERLYSNLDTTQLDFARPNAVIQMMAVLLKIKGQVFVNMVFQKYFLSYTAAQAGFVLCCIIYYR